VVVCHFGGLDWLAQEIGIVVEIESQLENVSYFELVSLKSRESTGQQVQACMVD
jgi:hypothetical protein